MTAPPPGTVEGGSDAALQTAMATTLFHWTLHPWAIYAVVGIAIAYGTFRRGRSQLISSAFAPLLGKRTEGPIGKVIDSQAKANLQVKSNNSFKGDGQYERKDNFTARITATVLEVKPNGTLVLDSGAYTGQRPGRVLRGPGYRGGRTE